MADKKKDKLSESRTFNSRETVQFDVSTIDPNSLLEDMQEVMEKEEKASSILDSLLPEKEEDPFADIFSDDLGMPSLDAPFSIDDLTQKTKSSSSIQEQIQKETPQEEESFQELSPSNASEITEEKDSPEEELSSLVNSMPIFEPEQLEEKEEPLFAGDILKSEEKEEGEAKGLEIGSEEEKKEPLDFSDLLRSEEPATESPSAQEEEFRLPSLEEIEEESTGESPFFTSLPEEEEKEKADFEDVPESLKAGMDPKSTLLFGFDMSELEGLNEEQKEKLEAVKEALEKEEEAGRNRVTTGEFGAVEEEDIVAQEEAQEKAFDEEREESSALSADDELFPNVESEDDFQLASPEKLAPSAKEEERAQKDIKMLGVSDLLANNSIEEEKIATELELEMEEPFEKEEEAASSFRVSAKGERGTILPTVHLTDKGLELREISKSRFNYLSPLGSCTLGDVALMQDNDIQRQVAIKFLKKEHHTSAGVVRFMREIRSIGQLEHPNIVPLYDVGVDPDGRFYFIMKNLTGETLADVIQKLKDGHPAYHKRFTFAYRVQVFLEILRAIKFAHDKGIIHRDIKPANIMIGQHGEVIVTNWWIAKKIRRIPGQEEFSEALDELTQQVGPRRHSNETNRFFETRDDSLIGTPAYMSPEQALGQNDKIDERSDIYALSILFHEFLALEHSLADKTTLQEVLSGIVKEKPTPLNRVKNKYQGSIPIELHYIVERGYAKAPSKRYQTVDSMMQDIQDFLDGHNKINCPTTFLKHVGMSYMRFLDASKLFGVIITFFLFILTLVGAYTAALWLFDILKPLL